ncbi:MAG TPA: 50S ribosomal protein L32 [Phycisphaerales bacterium]|nr:50S ribosomal protein L32 [Phycisphaerales bacterium]
MAEPKYKLSRSRTRRRRSHLALKAPNVQPCSNCGQPTLPHVVCRSCFTYRGRQVWSEKDDEE